MQKVDVAMTLSQLVNSGGGDDDQRVNYTRFDVFEDFNDYALVVKRFDGICFASFSATHGGSDNTIARAMSTFGIHVLRDDSAVHY